MIEHVRTELWEPRRGARANALAFEPATVKYLATKGLELGLDAAVEPELMWLVDVALASELPVGWTVVEFGAGEGHFYWNPVCGLTLWESPMDAFICGVAERLQKLRQDGALARRTLSLLTPTHRPPDVRPWQREATTAYANSLRKAKG